MTSRVEGNPDIKRRLQNFLDSNLANAESERGAWHPLESGLHCLVEFVVDPEVIERTVEAERAELAVAITNATRRTRVFLG